MKMTRSIFVVALVLSVVSFGSGIYLLRLRRLSDSSDSPGRKQLISSAVPSGVEEAKLNNTVEKEATGRKTFLNYSKLNWLEWIKGNANFRIVRKQEDWERNVVACDLEAFKAMGLDREAYAVIVSFIKIATADLYPHGIAHLTPERFKELSLTDDLPELVEETDSSSKYLFKINKAVGSRQNSAKNLLDDLILNLAYNEGVPEDARKVAPLLAEAVVEWCLEQPVIRKFGKAELAVTFENIIKDGEQLLRVTETMSGADGAPDIIHQFTSPEIPAPYDRLFLTK